MLRRTSPHPPAPSSNDSTCGDSTITVDKSASVSSSSRRSSLDDPKGRLRKSGRDRDRTSVTVTVTSVLLSLAFLLGMVLQYSMHVVERVEGDKHKSVNQQLGQAQKDGVSPTIPSPEQIKLAPGFSSSVKKVLQPDFHPMLDRAVLNEQHCRAIGLADDPFSARVLAAANVDNDIMNNHTAHLSQFGILDSARKYAQQVTSGAISAKDYPYQCQLPPENECGETQITVIFMAYNPDRLQKMYDQIYKMLTGHGFSQLIKEVIVVWNGERKVEETKLGQDLIELSKTMPVRISYPLRAGFPNDLMNRYHPRLQIKTKAIMYYDDDGPFYSYEASLAGFELWKRNANAQIGAMARKLDLGPRQADERKAMLNGPGDRFFVSQCPTDSLRYNYNEFANFGANMVLPSGSFLHANYLCFLWHPLFADIRDYVQKHPVNPDDGTVSIIVSQLAGRAPKVYSRRLNPQTVPRQRRRLMDGIDWDTKDSHGDKKSKWGRLRSDAANSLVRYFGSMNSGSIGWCYGTKYQQGEYCKPEMAKIGMLPWMTERNRPRDVCP